MKINRVAKVVKGGRRFSFTALVVVGDEVDHVGVGYGKANEVPSAIAKAVEDAKKNLFQIPKYRNTITHQVTGRYGAGRVFMKPASEGTGVIAGAGVRAVLELGGVRDILAKSLGTANPINLLMATVQGLKSLKRPEEVAKLRGLTIREVIKPHSEVVADAEAAAAAKASLTAAAVVEAPAPAAAEPKPAAKPAAKAAKPAAAAKPQARRRPAQAGGEAQARAGGGRRGDRGRARAGGRGREGRGRLMAKLRITQVRGTIRTRPEHKGTLRALGLRKINAQTVREDSPVLQGMLRRVASMVRGGGDRWLKRRPLRPACTSCDRLRAATAPASASAGARAPAAARPPAAARRARSRGRAATACAPASRAARCRSTCAWASCAAPTTASRCRWARSARTRRP